MLHSKTLRIATKTSMQGNADRVNIQTEGRMAEGNHELEFFATKSRGEDNRMPKLSTYLGLKLLASVKIQKGRHGCQLVHQTLEEKVVSGAGVAVGKEGWPPGPEWPPTHNRLEVA